MIVDLVEFRRRVFYDAFKYADNLNIYYDLFHHWNVGFNMKIVNNSVYSNSVYRKLSYFITHDGNV